VQRGGETAWFVEKIVVVDMGVAPGQHTSTAMKARAMAQTAQAHAAASSAASGILTTFVANCWVGSEECVTPAVRAVPAQMWYGASPVAAQTWRGLSPVPIHSHRPALRRTAAPASPEAARGDTPCGCRGSVELGASMPAATTIYTISVVTGDVRFGGTDAAVHCTLWGSTGCSGYLLLDKFAQARPAYRADRNKRTVNRNKRIDDRNKRIDDRHDATDDLSLLSTCLRWRARV
jgi:hypothetical protein